jgi:hypothetical protein
VKAAYPEEGGESEREREGRDSCTSQREETKRKEQPTHTALSMQKERGNGKTGEEERRREFALV